MKVNYNATGKERKRLAQAIGKAIGVDAIYKGVPTCTYEIGYFTVDREGTLIFDDAADSHVTAGGHRTMTGAVCLLKRDIIAHPYEVMAHRFACSYRS